MNKHRAIALGNEMMAQLGEGWTLSLFENLGWWATAHSSSKHLYVSVADGKKPTYTCLMTDDPKNFSSCGNPIWSIDDKTFYNPVAAVLNQVKYARERVNHLNEAVLVAEHTVSKLLPCPCCGKPRTL